MRLKVHFFDASHDISLGKSCTKFMNSFEINKIIAAIILTIVIVFGVNKLADVIYNVKAPEGNTYNIVTETKEISKDDAVKVEGDVNISALLALGSISIMERWYLKNVPHVIQCRKVGAIRSALLYGE